MKMVMFLLIPVLFSVASNIAHGARSHGVFHSHRKNVDSREGLFLTLTGHETHDTHKKTHHPVSRSSGIEGSQETIGDFTKRFNIKTESNADKALKTLLGNEPSNTLTKHAKSMYDTDIKTPHLASRSGGIECPQKTMEDFTKRFDITRENNVDTALEKLSLLDDESISSEQGLFHELTEIIDIMKESDADRVIRKQLGNRPLSGGRGILSGLTADLQSIRKRGLLGMLSNGIKRTIDRTRRVIKWMTGTTIRIGKKLVEAPLRGVELSINAAYRARVFGMGLTAKIISDTAEWFEGNWDAVKAIDFPGKNILIMFYPRGLMSVLDKITKEITYILDATHKEFKNAFVYTLYVSLKFIFLIVNKVITASGLDCVKVKGQNIPINRNAIKDIHTTSGEACGVSHLKPLNNITITRSDEKFLIVTSAWILDDISVTLTGVKVSSDLFGTVLSNQTMVTKIKRIKATGTVEFQAGTLLRFVRIHIVVDNMEGLEVRFPNQDHNGYMDLIENMADSFTSIVTKEVNRVLSMIEKKVFDYIAQS